VQPDAKRLLILIHSLRGGGAGRVCSFLANGLARRGWDVTVAVNLPENQRWIGSFDSGVSIHQLNARHARWVFPGLVSLVRSFRPDVVLAFNYQLAVLLPFVRTFARVPFKAVGRTVVALSEAARYRSFWQREIVMPFVRRRYRHLDLVIAQAGAMREDLLAHFSLRNDQVVVINNPAVTDTRSAAWMDNSPDADQDEYLAGGVAQEGRDLRPADGSDAEARTPRLLYLGRFKPQKQPHLLLDFMERLRRKHGFEQARLIAAGEGPLTDEFLSQVSARGLEEAIDYRGFTGNIDPLFDEADLTVLVSRYEGFPNVLVESIARGVPVLSFDCPSGPSDIIEEGVNGMLVPMNDMDNMIDAAVKLLRDPPACAQVLSTAERFHPEKILDRYEEVLGSS